jgi:hypothetical protein
MKKSFSLIVVFFFVFISFEAKAQKGKEELIDPSKLTNLYTQVNLNTEYITGNEQKLYGLRANISYTPNADNLILVELPLLNNDKTSKFGIGDMRFRYFSAVKRNISPTFIAIAPFLDISIPSGNFKDGLGTSAWSISAGSVIGLVFTEQFSVFPGIGIVHITKPNTGTIPDSLKTTSTGIGIQTNISYSINKTTFVYFNPNPAILNTSGVWKVNWMTDVSLSKIVIPNKLQLNLYWGPNFTSEVHSFRLGGTFYL